jgi:heme A synthase
MMNLMQIFLIVCVFAAVFVAGIWLANATKEELKDGRKYFRILMKICLLFIAVSAVCGIFSGFSNGILIVILTLAAVFLITLVSFLKSKSRRER